ncbi:MAG: hypothetical protein MI924_22980 [Chloroflexales bacterium]|nr:hypothetical protein [Chloroflexales bacterium]
MINSLRGDPGASRLTQEALARISSRGDPDFGTMDFAAPHPRPTLIAATSIARRR